MQFREVYVCYRVYTCTVYALYVMYAYLYSSLQLIYKLLMNVFHPLTVHLEELMEHAGKPVETV